MSQENMRQADHTTGVQDYSETNLTGALLKKRDMLKQSLHCLEAKCAELDKQYTEAINKIKAEKKLQEEALQHLEALLRIEGYIFTNTSTPSCNNADSIPNGLFIEDAYKVLENKGTPLHYKTVTEHLLAQGVHIPGKEPAATLLSKMNRDDRFKRCGRGIYGLSTWRLKVATRRRKTRKKRRSKGGTG